MASVLVRAIRRRLRERRAEALTRRDWGDEWDGLPRVPEGLDELRSLLGRYECVYLHDEKGEPLAMVLPMGGWWQDQLPEAPLEHFSHAHMHPWGEQE